MRHTPTRNGSRRPPLPAAWRGLPPVFWWIWAGLVVNWTGSFAGPMLAFSLTTDRGYSASSTGLVVSLLGAGAFAGNLLGGALADRAGRRRVLIAGHCLGAAGMATLGLADQGGTVALAATGVGLGAGAARTAAGAVLADVLPAEDRQRAFALNYWAVNAGTAVSAVLAGLLVVHGYLLLFLADAAATALCALLVWARVPETLPASRTHPGPRAATAPVRGDRLFVLFVLLTALFAMVLEQRSGALAVVMAGQGHTPTDFSVVNAVNALLVVALQIPLSRIAEKRSPGGVLAAGGLLVAAGLGLTGLADSLAAYAALTVLWTLGEMLQAPAGSAVTAGRAPESRRGRYLGAYGGAWSAAAFLGPVAGGWCLDQWGAPTLWALCAALGSAAGCGWLLTVGREDFRTATAVRTGGGSPPPTALAPNGQEPDRKGRPS
ncbi:MDR family MFS transporter [Streptomyces sp. NPDC085529]|uniref:MDR family MFS transporter n=1 Tax=Streptomyces sp. NPDC085529 TaxID=3365729 RepID=UPI0037CD4B30